MNLIIVSIFIMCWALFLGPAPKKSSGPQKKKFFGGPKKTFFFIYFLAELDHSKTFFFSKKKYFLGGWSKHDGGSEGSCVNIILTLTPISNVQLFEAVIFSFERSARFFVLQ